MSQLACPSTLLQGQTVLPQTILSMAAGGQNEGVRVFPGLTDMLIVNHCADPPERQPPVCVPSIKAQ